MNKPIRNLRDLKKEKRRLSTQVKQDTPTAAISGITSLVSLGKTKKQTDNSINNLVENSLYFVSAKANDKFKLNKTTRGIIALIISLLVPVITTKIENFSLRKRKS